MAPSDAARMLSEHCVPCMARLVTHLLTLGHSWELSKHHGARRRSAAMTLGAGSRHVHAVHRHTATALDIGLDDAARTAVGGKGRAVAAMAAMGLPVPPAFCITSDWCDECAHDPAAIVDRMWPDVLDGLKVLEGRTGCTFGAGPRPLLLSVRSSGVTSMPGMLDTVLNVGIDDAVADALGTRYSVRFAHDTRERFRRGYRRAIPGDAPVPAEPLAQLRGAIEAVASSWSSSRVSTYRAHHRLERGGIAILLQAMVFGNLDARSGTGVLFTRDPASGASSPFGEWLPAAQGDDVVSGTSSGEPLDAMRERPSGRVRRVDRRRPAPGTAWLRRPGRRVHRRGGHAVAAAVPGGETLPAGRGAAGPGVPRRGRHRRRRGAAPGDPRAARLGARRCGRLRPARRWPPARRPAPASRRGWSA